MDTYAPDNSGINSLGGFSYQIRVFVLHMLSMEEEMQAGFETIDDVAIKSVTPSSIDDYEDNFRKLLVSEDEIHAIQVKRTTITNASAKHILLNWVLLEKSNQNVTHYIVFTDKRYGNKDIISTLSVEELYEEILLSKEKSKASTVVKIKSQYENDKSSFFEICNKIKSKYLFVEEENVDKEIDKKCQNFFKKGGVTSITYYNRIEELLRHITFEVMESINTKKPYTISYKNMMSCLEEICNRITDEFIYPRYSEFSALSEVDIEKLEIAKSREYIQLLTCNMPQTLLERHLLYGMYYKNIRYKYLELNKQGIVRDIEQTTYENFEDAKYKLQCIGKDEPYNRLDETKKLTNTYTKNEQIKYGSGIYLSREDEKKRQISWEDEENAKLGIRGGITSN